jgi:hydrogenase maturation protease
MGGETLVIGYGNALLGDDAAGPRVAAAVARWRLPGVRALSLHQLLPELTAELGGAARVIFVDASARSPEPSGVAIHSLPPVPPAGRGASLGHTGDPAELLHLTRALYDHWPESWWILIPAERFGVGQGLSPAARRGIRHALRTIRRLLLSEPDAAGGGRRESTNQD